MSGRYVKKPVPAKNVKCIEKKNLYEFVKELTSDMRKEFYDILKNIHIRVQKVHLHYHIEIDKKAFLGKFHGYFIQKVIYNIKNEDWQNKTLSMYASIFPFKVFKDVADVNLDIFELFDSDFKNDVKEFLQDHFDDVGEIDDVIKLFLRNVHAFKATNTQIGPYGDEAVSDAIGVEKLDELLNNMKLADGTLGIPRLTEKGVIRYKHLYNLTRQAMQSFCPSQAETIKFDEYDEWYFRHLPENNLIELQSLLKPNFYQMDPNQYKIVFIKYLFFFLHAFRSGENPVFFIDELLFQCLKSLRIFEKSRENPIILKSHIANLTCVYQRLQPPNRDNGFVVSDTSLEEIKKFFETGVKGIESALVNYSIEGAILENKIFACTDQEAFATCFSYSTKDKPMYFIDLIIQAAFSEKNFETLSIYNVYLGTKAWMYNPSVNKEAILNFVRKYSKYVPKKLPPEYFITERLEDCFELSASG